MKRVALVVAVLLLASCGGGSSGLGKSDYVKQAEAICKDANDKADALPAPSDPASFQKLVEDSLKIAEDATTRIKELDPPEGDKDDLDTKVLEPLANQIATGRAYLGEVKQAVAKKDQVALGRLLTNPPEGKKADLDWMRSYGFKECVESASTEG